MRFQNHTESYMVHDDLYSKGTRNKNELSFRVIIIRIKISVHFTNKIKPVTHTGFIYLINYPGVGATLYFIRKNGGTNICHLSKVDILYIALCYPEHQEGFEVLNYQTPTGKGYHF